MQSIMRIFPKRLSDARIGAGISQSELARRIFVRRESVARWEQGTRVPSAENIAILCRVLHVSADWLLGLGEKESAPNADTSEGADEKTS